MPDSRTMAWPGLCLALGVGSLYAWSGGRQFLLVWHADGWAHHPWQLWTASLAHLSSAHLLINLAALLAMAVLGVFLQVGRNAVFACLLAWPLGTLALSFWSDIGYYSGMSGLLMAMLAVLAVFASAQAGTRGTGVFLLIVLGFKLLTEHAWTQPLAFDPRWGFNVVYAAHLTGALAGGASALLCAALRAWRHPAGV